MVLALLANGLLAFGLWVHHMFATGLPRLGDSFYTSASMMIGVPAGVQIFCWIATLWDGKPRFKTPLLFVIGFIVIFVLGGLTGIMLASVPLDLQVHDTYFVVAHFHYVLVGGAVFPLFGGFYYWFPKFTGRLMNERLGTWNFWLFFIGFNVTFFPMHILGLIGMPRRVYTYPAGTGWELWNQIAGIGAVLIAISVLLFIVNAVRSLRHGEIASDNPWEASTLEWATSSPPPSYNFAYVPIVSAREALWQEGEIAWMEGLASGEREILCTTPIEAEPDLRHTLPKASIWPLITAVGTTAMFIGSIFDQWAVIWGVIPIAFGLIGWLWPTTPPKFGRRTPA
jgi:cytochrome c oxidase subunit 1